MAKLLCRLLLCLASLQLVACATSGTVVVRSNPPDANVFMFDSNTGQSSLLGKTPVTFSKELAEEKHSDIFQLRIEKEGYESKFTSVAAFSRETTYVDLQLSSSLAVNNDLKKAFELNRQLMQEANRLASSKRFSEALTRVEKVLETDPKNDDAQAAKGSLLYLMKDFEGAQNAWKKALENNPSNEMVRSSLIDLNLSLEGPKRSPANKGGK